jgi:hypothetical protein
MPPASSSKKKPPVKPGRFNPLKVVAPESERFEKPLFDLQIVASGGVIRRGLITFPVIRKSHLQGLSDRLMTPKVPEQGGALQM